MVWLIFLVIALPIIGVLAWILLDDSFVRVEPGTLGLLLVKGKATDVALTPGPHWVPALRRREVQIYPSTEMSYRAATIDTTTASGLEQSGPVIGAWLADRSTALVSYTVRFRLDVLKLRIVHERFGPAGIWSAVRDEAEAAMRDALGQTSVDDLFKNTAQLEQRLLDAVSSRLAPAGIVVMMLHVGDLDLGRTGEVIAATSRARHELAREEAEAAMRLARARVDADLAPFVGAIGAELALRYREVDSWRDLARASNVVVPVPGRPQPPEPPPADSRRETREARSEAPAEGQQ